MTYDAARFQKHVQTMKNCTGRVGTMKKRPEKMINRRTPEKPKSLNPVVW
jgi:hypothetical protein